MNKPKWSLKGLRANSNLTQKEMAKELGISRSTYIRIENKKMIPSLQIANDISNYFNVSIEEIDFY